MFGNELIYENSVLHLSLDIFSHHFQVQIKIRRSVNLKIPVNVIQPETT